jgi:hypothetical protein
MGSSYLLSSKTQPKPGGSAAPTAPGPPWTKCAPPVPFSALQSTANAGAAHVPGPMAPSTPAILSAAALRRQLCPSWWPLAYTCSTPSTAQAQVKFFCQEEGWSVAATSTTHCGCPALFPHTRTNDSSDDNYTCCSRTIASLHSRCRP